ncbi:MAG: glycosyltransferase family 4 protein [Planctomycetes bacterium]|nr:glycosyltransferase family 4 protein [Planctomycetota bacterium]
MPDPGAAPPAPYSGPVKVLHLAAADSMLFPILRDQLVYLRGLGYQIHTASIDGPLAHRLRDEDRFSWTALPLTRTIDMRQDWRAVKFIEELCAKERFDIVHTHTPKGNVVGQLAARRARVPVVLQTLHGFYFHERMGWLKRRIWIAVERFSASNGDFVLCQNPEDVETAVRERIVPREKIALLGNGIDLDRFRPALLSADARAELRKELKIPAEALVVGMSARFVKEKGLPEFLAAGKRLLAKHERLHLLLVGLKLDSERATEVCNPLAQDFPPERLTVLADRNDMPRLYVCMDVHVLPSHREGFPRALMEGAASGLPQVATDIRGCRQCIEPGATGSLVPVNDAEKLAEAIGALLEDPNLRKRLGAAARAKAEREFDQRKVFTLVAETYARLLRAKMPGRPVPGGASP